MNAPLAKEQIALLMSDSLTYREAGVQGTEGTIGETTRPGLRARVAGWVAAAREALERRAVLAELRQLSDRELADIGLARAELGRVFETGSARSRG
jgi:uncharacterized protein YjiS (DUF1127 family)